MLEGEPARIRSRTERRLLSAIRAAGLPEPEVNVKLGPWEIDFLWRDAGLAVELHGYDSHASPRAFARDYHKNAALEGYGFEVTRVSADQARDDTAATVVRIGRALSRSARGRDPGRGLRYQS
jgi:very-short-patch-repair endonuclease